MYVSKIKHKYTRHRKTRYCQEETGNKLSDKIKKNDEQKRFHYLQGDREKGIPELVIDFKHFYTVPRDVLYDKRKALYVATISELYREELSQRFSNFLARIGLPDAI